MAANEDKDYVAAVGEKRSLSSEATPQTGVISYAVFTNDDRDESLIALVTLKNIFSKQLPKMPRDYIVRLVFDKRHKSFAIMLDGRIIGGVCYRTYRDQRFGEIAFCAISGTEQVKGYGSILMNNLKRHAQVEGLEYFLTYADNYAIGYFQKQGFSKTITMPKDRWSGFIKDYDGATLVECYIHPGMDYTRVREIVAIQRNFVYKKIKERSTSHIVYPGISSLDEGRRIKSIFDVPGVYEAGYTPSSLYKGTTERDRNTQATKLNIALESDFKKIKMSPKAEPFDEPVSLEDAPDYLTKIRYPIDLQTIQKLLKESDYYRSKDMLRSDLMRIVSNCKTYNPEGSEYYQAAEEFERVVVEVLDKDVIAAAPEMDRA